MLALSILIPFVATAACSTAAVVTRTDQATARAKIIGGSEQDLFVEDESDRPRRIPRTEIYSIRHPGGLDIGLGVLFTAVGGVTVFEQSSRCGADARGDTICGAALVPVAVGLGLLIWGAVVNRDSNAAARDSSRQSVLGYVPALPSAAWHAPPVPRPPQPPPGSDYRSRSPYGDRPPDPYY